MSASRHRYRAYGEILDSAMEFPELRPVAPAVAAPAAATSGTTSGATSGAAARWTFDPVARLGPPSQARELGADRIYGDVHARLFACADGHRIVVDDTGTFAMDPTRRHVRWEERADAWPDFVRAHLLGRVLATAMYLDGRLPLHGSAVAARDGVLAFLAPKGYGKSTLALALAEAGARLVTDDTLPVDPTPDGPIAWPGIHGLRVHDDALAAVGALRPVLDTREGKRIVTAFGEERLQDAPLPLRAIYLLVPSASDDDLARLAFEAPLAAIGVVAHVKIGRMLGGPEAATMLARAAAITRGAPVHQLRVPRALDRLAASAAGILAWHGGAP
jgi:hypothetical protein